MSVKENQLVGTDSDRDGLRHVARTHTEELSSWGVPQRRNQRDGVAIQNGLYAFSVNTPHRAAMEVINPVANANRPGRYDVPCHDPNVRVFQGRVGQPHRQQPFELHSLFGSGVNGGGQSQIIGYAEAIAQYGRMVRWQCRVDGFTGGMDQYQSHSQRV